MSAARDAGRQAGPVEELRRDWSTFCDADWVDPDFPERMEEAGLITLRKVRRSDVQEDPFAYERGIEMGGTIWVLTDSGRRALAIATGEGGDRGE